jgi:hypothetical protein
MPEFLSKSALNRKVSSRLTAPFNVMSTFFFRRSVEKAFQLDEFPSGLSLNLSKSLDGTPPFIISAVDDVMYIVNTVLQRSISTSQRDVIASVIPTVSRVLGSDFIGMIQRKMRDESYPKPVIQGGFPPESKIIDFIVLINSLDVANEYITRIVNQRLSVTDGQEAIGGPNSNLKEMFPFDHDSVFVENALSNLNSSFSSKSSELIGDGLQVMYNQVVKPRLRPVLSDTFRDVDYTLSEEELAELARQNDTEEDEVIEMVTRRFEHSWEALMKPIARVMATKPFAMLLEQTAKYLAHVLEKRIWNFSGRTNGFGAARMERDFAGLVGAVAKGGKYGIRELFSRINQILMIANMEEDEWEELKAGVDDGIVWVLNEEEKARARAIVR